jgi:hypothetical protein
VFTAKTLGDYKMAIQKRYNGDATGIVNGDISLHGVSSAPGVIISTGIGKHPTFVKISGGASLDAELGVGGAVEAMIRVMTIKATVLAYQVDGAQMSVLLESSGWGYESTGGATAAADLTAALAALGNRAADPAVPVSAYNFGPVVAATAGGFKLA